MKNLELSRRDQEVLQAIVKAYIETGEPVGSRTVSRQNREGLSAATIRNVMAELEERDLLVQPHTSAGRVPTDLGYRVYVDSLAGTRPLAPADKELIESAMQGSPADEGDLLTSASRVLSRLSRHLGVVVSPHIDRVRLRDMEFVRLGPHRVLVILVAASGGLHNKVIETAADHEQDKLDQIGRYLTDEFKGHTLPEIRDRILEMMSQEKTLYDTLLRDALALGRAGLDIEPGATVPLGEVYVDGTTNLIAEPEFASVERLKTLFRAFEEKHELLKVLNSCLEQVPGGVRVIIGSENPNPFMADCALIASGYGPQGQTLGTLGIIGPTRMEYARAIALVDSVARVLSRALGRLQD